MARTKLTRQIIQAVEDVMYLGGTKYAAAYYARVSYSSFMRWQAIGEEARKKKEEGKSLDKFEKLCLELVEAIERGLGQFAVEALSELQNARRNGGAEISYRLLKARIPDFEPPQRAETGDGEHKIVVRLQYD